VGDARERTTGGVGLGLTNRRSHHPPAPAHRPRGQRAPRRPRGRAEPAPGRAPSRRRRPRSSPRARP